MEKASLLVVCLSAELRRSPLARTRVIYGQALGCPTLLLRTQLELVSASVRIGRLLMGSST